MPRSLLKRLRGPLGWAAAIALALAPKCLFCLALYAGLGAALGIRLGAQEICGESPGSWASQIPWLAIAGVAVAFAAVRLLRPTR